MERTHELSRRLQYAAWCRQFSIQPGMSDFEDSPWWLILSLQQSAFEDVSRRVGLTLSYARDSRLRMLRGPAQDLSLLRWALSRAQTLPDTVLALACAPAPQHSPESFAATSLWSCADQAPLLWPRLRLRFPFEAVPEGVSASQRRGRDATARMQLAGLWRAALRAQELQ